MMSRSKAIVSLSLLFFAGMGATIAYRSIDSSNEPARIDRNDGVFISVVSIVSSQCAICNDSRIIDGIQESITTVRIIAEKVNLASNVKMVSVDSEIESGLEYLSHFTDLDEIVVGNNWRNSGAFDHIWNQDVIQASTPQIIVSIEEVKLSSANGLIAKLDRTEAELHRASSAQTILDLPIFLSSDEFTELLEKRLLVLMTQEDEE